MVPVRCGRRGSGARSRGLARVFAWAVTALVAVIAGCRPADPASPPGVERADSAVAAWVEAERIPGAVLAVTRDGELVHERAFGYARLYRYGEPDPVRLEEPEVMTPEHLFDLASVTKVMTTTFGAMLLVDRGKLDLDAPVRRYLPEFSGPRKDSVTVRHLLTHGAGLRQWQPLYYRASTPEEAVSAIADMPLRWGVGEGRHYSDLGFILLGHVVERIAGRTLGAFLRDELYAPLGLETLGFRPRDRGFAAFAATSHGNPFERRMVHDPDFGYRYPGDPEAWSGWRRRTLVGEVNDGNAFHAHRGRAGHAGLFGRARELGVLVELLLGGGAYRGRRHLSADVVRRFLEPGAFPGQALGWRTPPDRPEGTFEHTGFTGTYVAGIPARGLGVVLLTNRQNVGLGPDHRYPDVDPLRAAVRETLLTAGRRGG